MEFDIEQEIVGNAQNVLNQNAVETGSVGIGVINNVLDSVVRKLRPKFASFEIKGSKSGKELESKDSLPLSNSTTVEFENENKTIFNDLDRAFENWIYWTEGEKDKNRLRAIGSTISRMIFDEFYSEDVAMELRMFGVDNTKKVEANN